MLDPCGVLIYVGKAKRLRTRLLSYFRPASRDAKAGRIVTQTQSIVWEVQPSEFAALLRELELIRRWRPRFNVAGEPLRRRRTCVCLGRRPAPHAFLAHRPPATAFAWFGPVPVGRQAREAVRRLNDWFGLRDCPQAQRMVFADEAELFPVARTAGCIRHEIGNCLGPCAGACSRSAYKERVRAARAFLAGADAGPLRSLEGEMAVASGALAFERAAAVRDKLEPLRWLWDQLARLRTAREQQSFVYAVAGPGQPDRWYLIDRGRVEAVLAAPLDMQGGRTAAAAIEGVYRRRPPWDDPVPGDELETVFLVGGWFRRHPEERLRTLSPVAALQRCRTTS
jgi:excinuclease ABC subunit C